MALVFVGIDPDTGGDNCPAVFIDEETGDFLLQGWTVTDPGTLAEVERSSPIADNESVVRLPARMRAGSKASPSRNRRCRTGMSLSVLRSPGGSGSAVPGSYPSRCHRSCGSSTG